MEEKKGHLGFPILELNTGFYQEKYQTRLRRQYMEILKSEQLGAETLKALQNDRRVADLKGQMIPGGHASFRFNIETLALWYLWAANEEGAEAANSKLNDFLDGKPVTRDHVVWVVGLTTEKPLHFSKSISIIPISEMGPSDEKEIYLQMSPNFVDFINPTPQTAIVKAFSLPGAEIPGHNALVDLHSHSKAVFKELEDFALILNLISGVTCAPYYITTYPSYGLPMGPFAGQGGSIPGVDSTLLSTSKIEQRHVSKLNKLVENFFRLAEKEQDRFRNIFFRLSQGKRRFRITDRLLDLCISLEMVLLNDNDNYNQLSLSFRERGAWLLGKSGKERSEIYNYLKHLYKCRSSIAHSGTIKPTDRKKAIAEFPKYIELAETACQKVLMNGQPDWVNLVINFKP